MNTDNLHGMVNHMVGDHKPEEESAKKPSDNTQPTQYDRKTHAERMKQLDNNYKYHTPSKNQQAFYAKLREDARELAQAFEELCPDGREKSLAHTKLEEALMWANASIARND